MPRNISEFYCWPMAERAHFCLDVGDLIAEKSSNEKIFLLYNLEDFFVEVVGSIRNNCITFERATPLRTIKPRKTAFYAEAISIDSLFSNLNN